MTAAKYPASLVALTDLGGELPDAAAPTELTLDGAITDSGTAILCNETIPTEYPASGWIRIDDEVIHYSSFTSKTFTADVRGAQTAYGAGAAAAHDDNATVGMWMSAQMINQLLAEVVSLEKTGAGGKGANISSVGGTITLTTDGQYFHVTGTTTITAISARVTGAEVALVFDDALILTHHATNLILRGGANVTTAAGDVFIFRSEGSAQWREIGRCTTSSIGTTADFVLIDEQVLGSDAANFDFTSIPQTYRSLLVVIQGRGTTASGQINVQLRFNNDSGANYDYQFHRGIAGTPVASEALGATGGFFGHLSGASAAAGIAGQAEARIANYSGSTFHKTYTGKAGAKSGTSSGDLVVYDSAGFWRNTAAITRVTVIPSADNFLAGTVCSLYGLR